MRDPRTTAPSPAPRARGRSGPSSARACLALLASLASLALGCDAGGASALSVEIVDGSGGNPVAGIARGTLTLRVSQTGSTDVVALAGITGGLFDTTLPIASYAAVTTIEVTIDDGVSPDPLVGATIPFQPVGYGRVRIVVGRPGTCVTLAAPHLPVAVDSPALALQGVRLLLVGGRSDAAATRAEVHVLSPLELTLPMTPVLLGRLATPIGPSVAAPLAPPPRTEILVVSDSGGIVFDVAQRVTGARDRPLDPALAADSDAVLVALGELGVAVVGRDQITFLGPDGSATHTRALDRPRTGAAAARLGDGILVAGGGAAGDFLFEWHPIAAASRDIRPMVFGDALAQRTDAAIAVSPTSDRALFVFGHSADDGSLVPGSVVVSGCPTRCTASAGPDVTRLRTGAVAVPRVSLPAIARPATTLLVGGAELDLSTVPPTLVPIDDVDSVSWDGATPLVEPATSGLRTPRVGHAALPLGASVVLVAGGTGPSTFLSDLELCF